ncbi:MAG: type 4a pilus biogenesis protein PilO [Candidatus Omnitrophica bacterium]|nr:type 4a pilus biogenesis protein PilO [Candidatus Omnitrophota bacterium]
MNDRKTVLKSREKVMMVAAGVAVFSLLWTYIIVRPIQNYEHDIDVNLKSKNLKLLEAKKALLETSVNSAVKNFLQKFSAQGSAQEEMSRLIKDIEMVATRSGLRVIEIKPQPRLQNAGWFELKVNISFEGSWDDIVGFLYQLEQDDNPFLVNEMTLEMIVAQQTMVRGKLEIERLFVVKSENLGP